MALSLHAFFLSPYFAPFYLDTFVSHIPNSRAKPLERGRRLDDKHARAADTGSTPCIVSSRLVSSRRNAKRATLMCISNFHMAIQL
jgi:hypothetical protein